MQKKAGVAVVPPRPRPAVRPRPRPRPRPVVAIRPQPRPRPFVPTDTPGPSRKKRKLHWVYFVSAAGVAVVAAAAATGLGAKTNQVFDDFRRADAAGDAARASSLKSDGQTYEAATNGMWGLASAAGVAAVVLAIFTRWKKKKEDPAAVSVAPMVGDGIAGISISFER